MIPHFTVIVPCIVSALKTKLKYFVAYESRTILKQYEYPIGGYTCLVQYKYVPPLASLFISGELDYLFYF